jgi:hypothetical protein
MPRLPGCDLPSVLAAGILRGLAMGRPFFSSSTQPGPGDKMSILFYHFTHFFLAPRWPENEIARRPV